MYKVEPKIFVVGEMQIKFDGIQEMLQTIGATEWRTSTGCSDNELLIEVSGRLCYKSFGTELNKNITKTREGNKPYIANILKTAHGSVVEHAVTSIAFINVSRIFTHELVRHRQGTAFSQESMRFVRLDDIPMWTPDLKEAFEEVTAYINTGNPPATADTLWKTYQKSMRDITELAETRIKEIADILDYAGVPFSLKKKITSALRRMAPSGHATNIVCTANHRAWRFMIQQRTDRSAEVEIRKVFEMVFQDFRERYPNLYQDIDTLIEVDGITEVKFQNHKI